MTALMTSFIMYSTEPREEVLFVLESGGGDYLDIELDSPTPWHYKVTCPNQVRAKLLKLIKNCLPSAIFLKR
jgi:hypothetical protein